MFEERQALIESSVVKYLYNNLGQGLRTSPFRAPVKAWALVSVFALVSLVAGFSTGLLKVEWLNSELAPLLPVMLFVFPSLLEEAFFRGVLIPRNIRQAGSAKAGAAVVVSTLVFVVWHPFNALAFNHSAIPLFLDPWFLVMVGALGITCGYGYVVSRSIWVPVMIHWAAVLAWVFLLGGRNLVLEL